MHKNDELRERKNKKYYTLNPPNTRNKQNSSSIN